MDDLKIKTMKTIKFPRTLNNVDSSYSFLAELQSSVINSKEDIIVFDMTSCDFYHAMFTSFLGTLLRIAHSFNKKATICTTVDSKVETYLKRSGLYSYVTGDSTDYTNRNSIPFRKISSNNEEAVINYVELILKRAPIKLTEQAHELLFKNIYEIFSNAEEHSRQDMGVFSCGHWMYQKRQLVFSLYDTGIGIPSLVKEKIETISTSKDALQWALQKGNSTKQLLEGVPRGLGLSDFLSFIKLNNGELIIFSNDLCFRYNKGTSHYFTIEKPIIGTFIGIIIVADEDHIYTTR